MKRFLLMCAMLLALGSAAWAATVTVMWDANTETDLAGYRLYQSDTSGVYTFGENHAIETIPAGTETVTIDDIPDGTYFCVLTAYDFGGNESGPSNEVEVTVDSVPPNAPVLLRITLVIPQ